ncbi:MAG: glycerol-3-phosphate 1-O-acyltransferase PlsY [Gammaproteobacteria bacterium]|jgi:glycerol-3-phosphate acyltransferase PlsY
MLITAVLILTAYLCGSVSSAVIVSKLLRLQDPRSGGSGNPGMTNVLRLSGKKAAALVFLGDVFKGAFPVLLARLLHIDGLWLGLVGLAAVIGHIFPVFFKFEGGKAIATSFGVVIILSPAIALLSLATWLVVAVVSRYLSLASIIGTVSALIYALYFRQFMYIIPFVIIAVLIIWRHKSNIKRLYQGSENKINLESKRA